MVQSKEKTPHGGSKPTFLGRKQRSHPQIHNMVDKTTSCAQHVVTRAEPSWVLQLTLVPTFIYSNRFTDACCREGRGRSGWEKTTPNLPLGEWPPKLFSAAPMIFPPN